MAFTGLPNENGGEGGFFSIKIGISLNLEQIIANFMFSSILVAVY
jgi:hypothetical protein